MPYIALDGQQVEYKLLYNKRRTTIMLKVTSPALIEITAPHKLTKSEIEQVFTAKQKWLKGQLAKLAALATHPANQSIATGAQVLYLGKPHTLNILSGGNQPEVIQKNCEILIKIPPAINNDDISTVTSQVLKIWLVNQAVKLFREKTSYWAQTVGVRPSRISIKEQKTRWGSCSSLGNINYNWRIIMAPPRVADYLVVHELCHMLEANHSAKFWDHVKRHMPDFKECRDWLKVNGNLLSRIL